MRPACLNNLKRENWVVKNGQMGNERGYDHHAVQSHGSMAHLYHPCGIFDRDDGGERLILCNWQLTATSEGIVGKAKR